MSANRRDFLKTAAFSTSLSQGRILGANDRVRIAGIGVGGRCRYLLQQLLKLGGTELVAVCDVYEPRRTDARGKLAPGAREYPDYRRLLEQSDIDAVVIGSPDHWHVPMTIDAIQSGKDVYLEKPVSHTIEEGLALKKAAAVSRCIIQIGYQQRSWEHFQLGREMIASGKLGKVFLILASWYQNYLRGLVVRPQVDAERLDWKGFLGSAPAQPFDPLRFTRWRWFWDFGGGHLTDLYSHWIDVIHWYMDSDSPLAVTAMGDRHAIPQFECPDTINACYQYPKEFSAVYTGTLVGSLDGGNLIFRGTQAMMKLNRDGFAVYPEGAVPAEATRYPEPLIAVRSAGDGTVAHLRNFLDCVRGRKIPNAPVDVGISAARAAHLGNQALRKGIKLATA
jgi:predicted dehydrogenase